MALKDKLIKYSELYKTGELAYISDEVYIDKINDRLTLYVSGPASGKFQMARSVADCDMVVTSDTKAEDLIQFFAFENGAPAFKNSELVNAIAGNKVIVIDDIEELRDDKALRMIDFISTADEINGVKIPDNFKMLCTFNPRVGNNWYCDIA